MSAQIDPFYAIGISKIAHQLKAEGRSIIHMEFGQPSTGAPQAAIARAHDILDTDGMGYFDSVPLKTRLAQHYLDSYGVQVSAEQFVLTCGASPALVLALSSAFSPGDRIALARPGYVAYRNVIKAVNLVPVEIACDATTRFQLTAMHLAELIPAPAGVIIASPANPTGTIIEADELAAITVVCRERGIQIISDEIYHGLSYTSPARSMLEFEPNAIVINSFSKFFSMVAWRLGWLLAPPKLAERAAAFASNMYLTPPTLSQHMALVALNNQDELHEHVKVYTENRRLLLNALPALGLTAIAPPDGAFYIYANIGHLTDNSLQFCEKLLRETGVATAPGIDFDPVDGRHFFRISFAVSTPQVVEAIERLQPWFAAQTR
ncbi:pyridoxal phosphate-dependent aminotransferase [Sapientia aquatica]|uniref:Aminotransferase n=1 Tax=Sapientia aquatica TaxID=1549640 RepID=A0A4R5W3W1_9BURK|nr:aminotransferase class I/II-fold pyridoxal phosphate-dependent enzyme [Sapientia aquatica]TDK66029.1 aminotransferase class I/II-fold pyridoxal phosphate-dependent enzyme [Sapientia aquatica]